MKDRNLLRGLFLIAIALAFGLPATQYPFGQLGRAGPGLFPVTVSCMLGIVGIALVIRSRFIERVPMDFSIRNISFILGSLIGFALIAQFVNMLLGIVFLVFFSSLAASSYSISRNIKVSLGLIAIAFGFVKLLGLQLPLY